MMVVKLIIWTILAIILIAVIPPVIFLLAAYRLVANLCLRWRILAPMDVIWDFEKDPDLPLGIITCVMVISGGKLTFHEFKSLFLEKGIHLIDPKFLCLRKSSIFGYHYWQNYKVNLDDHLKGLRSDEVVEEEEMRQILEELSDQKLPCDHQTQWEIYLGPHLKSKDGINQTVICRLHHSLGDGPSILRSILSVFAKKEELHLLTIPEDKVQQYLQNFPAQGSFYQKLVDIKTICSKLSTPPNENSFLHEISRLDGHMQIAWRCSSEMMQAAKSIRKSTGVSFSAALISSFLDALAQYRGYEDSYKNVTIDFPFLIKYEKEPKLANNFTYNFATFTMPEEGRDTLGHVEAVDQCLQKTKSMAVLIINGLMLRAIGWLCPRPLAKILTTTKNIQIGFSNVPGPEAELSNDNLKLHRVFGLQPRIGDRGIGVTVCSYRGVLSVGLNVDTAICKGPNDAEEIMQLWEKHLCQMAQDLAPKNYKHCD